MSKRNISYIKPEDPKFLQQLKQQIGYKEGPSVETKRQRLEDLQGDFDEGIVPEDEKPQVVVLNINDLTAEEVAIEEKRLAKEVVEAPADLSKPIVFRKLHKSARGKLDTGSLSEKSLKNIKDSKEKEINSRENLSKLSFNVEEEDQE